MSEEFVRHFIMPMDSRFVLVQKKEMQTTFQQIVDGLYAKCVKHDRQ